MRARVHLRLFLATVVALLAGSAVAWMNRSALLPATHSDGVEYTTAAASLARDGGFEIPVTHWSDPDSTTTLSHYPPGFSAAIAVPIAVAGVSPRVAVIAVLATGAAMAAALILWITSGIVGIGPGLFAALLLACTPALSRLYVGVWSESLYLGVALAGLWTVIARPRQAFLHGLVAAVGVAIRYVGVAGVVAAVWFAWNGRKGGRDRVLAVLAAGSPGALVLLGWQGYVGAGQEEIRRLAVYPGLPAQGRELVFLLAEWITPYNLARVAPVPVVILVLVVGGVAVMLGGWPKPSAHREAGVEADRALVAARARPVFLVYSVSYVAVVVLSRLLLDPLIPFDARLFVPVLVLLTIVFVVSLANRAGFWPRPVAIGAYSLLSIWMVFGVMDLREIVTISSENGRFYSHTAWTDDPAVRWAADESASFPWVYSNEAGMIWYHGHRTAKQLWRVQEDPAAFRAAYNARPGPILVTLPPKRVDVSLEMLEEALDVRLVMKSEHAALYFPADVDPSDVDGSRLEDAGAGALAR